MRKHLVQLVGTLALGSAPAAQAGQDVGPGMAEVPTAADVRALGGTVPAVVTDLPATGKEELFRRGIQGEVAVAGTVGVDGMMRDAVVVHSSHSTELDALATKLVAGATYSPAKDKAGRPLAVKVTVPIYLWKDSLADGSLFSKRCDDFVTDADWHTQAFPQEKPDQLRSWLLLTGASFAMRISRGDKALSGPTFDSVYQACRAKPRRKLADVYLDK